MTGLDITRYQQTFPSISAVWQHQPGWRAPSCLRKARIELINTYLKNSIPFLIQGSPSRVVSAGSLLAWLHIPLGPGILHWSHAYFNAACTAVVNSDAQQQHTDWTSHGASLHLFKVLQVQIYILRFIDTSSWTQLTYRLTAAILSYIRILTHRCFQLCVTMSC